MNHVLAIAVLLAPASAQAQASEALCADLRRVVAAAAETPPFASVTGFDPAPDFALFDHCRTNRLGPVDRVACWWPLPSPARAVERLAKEAASCLPRAVRSDPASAHPAAARFRLDALTIALEQDVVAPDTLGDGAALIVLIGEE